MTKFFIAARINVGFFRIWHSQVLRPPFISAATKDSNLEFVIQLVFGEYHAKTNGPKLAGVCARGAPPKFWDPYLFLQPLKVVTSNLVYNLGSGSSVSESTFGTKIGRGWAREHPQNFETPTYFCNNYS